MKMMIRSVCLAVLFAMTLSVSATVITDSFDTTHDYDASGISGTIWDGFFYNVAGGNTTVAAADANSSNAGVLTLRTTNGNWENADNDGVLLYKTVEGDFDARVKVTSMNVIPYHDAGLMARVADPADAGAGEDWVVVKRFSHQGNMGHRSTDDGVGSTHTVSGMLPWLRLTRSGNTITSYRSTDGANWSAISATSRNDMEGLALQVGVWQATFSGNEGNAQFDDFSLRTPTSWNSISNGSWTVNGNWTNGVPAGAGDRLLFPGILQGYDVSVTLDGDKIAGSMTFATTNSASYSIDAGTGSGALTINDNPGVDGINPFIAVNSGAHSISVPIVLSNGVTVATAWNSELTLRSGVSGSGGLIKNGVGSLTITGTNATYSGDTVVSQGTLSCLAIPEGIQASYMFEDSGNLGKDSSVNGNDLTTSGTPTYSASGKFGGAVYLDGSSHFVRTVFPTGVPTASTPYTIALWEKDDGSANTGGFVGWGNNAANQCNNLRFDGSSRLLNYWYANDWLITGITPDPKDGNWHHIAVTWDGSTQTLYLDGSYVTQTARSGLNAQANSFTVGRTTHPNDANFKGWLDNVQVANRALSAQEINGLAQSGGLENLLPIDTSVEVAEGAMVDLNGSSQALAGLSGDGRITSSSAAPVDLTIDSDSVQDFSGGIDGEIALTKVGNGSLTLSGVNAYNGGTTVSAGTLVMSMPLLQDVLSESKMWFDAADADTITTNASGVVTLWENKGTEGATLDALPITAGAGFTVLADELNGNPVLSLDGTNGMYSGANTGISGAQDRTLFVVGNRKNNGSIYLHTGVGSVGKSFGIASENTFLFNYIWGGDIVFPIRGNNVYEIYDYMIENYQSSANLISGETTLSGSKGVSPNTDNTPLYIGSRFGGVGNGNIAEVIFFDRALSQGERAGIEAYLRAKWFTGGSDDVLSAGAVSVAAGSVLDLDGTTQTLTELSGEGSVTNGTLKVINAIAPGGTDTVGTLSFASVDISEGTLLVDVTPGGASDLMQVQGALDLSGLTLEIADLDELKTGTRYVIATFAPGGLSGTFVVTNLSKGWQVSYNNTSGEVSLVCGGLILMIQ